MLRPQDGGEVSRDWKQRGWDFPGSPVVRTLCFYYKKKKKKKKAGQSGGYQRSSG